MYMDITQYRLHFQDPSDDYGLLRGVAVEATTFRPAIDKMTDKEEEYGLSAFRLKKKEWRLLEQLCEVLKVRLIALLTFLLLGLN